MLLHLLLPASFITPLVGWALGMLSFVGLCAATKGSVEFAVVVSIFLVRFSPLRYRVIRVIFSVMLFKLVRRRVFPGLTTEFGLFLTMATVVVATGAGWIDVNPLGDGRIPRLVFHVIFPIIIAHVEIRKARTESPGLMQLVEFHRFWFFLLFWDSSEFAVKAFVLVYGFSCLHYVFNRDRAITERPKPEQMSMGEVLGLFITQPWYTKTLRSYFAPLLATISVVVMVMRGDVRSLWATHAGAMVFTAVYLALSWFLSYTSLARLTENPFEAVECRARYVFDGKVKKVDWKEEVYDKDFEEEEEGIVIKIRSSSLNRDPSALQRKGSISQETLPRKGSIPQEPAPRKGSVNQEPAPRKGSVTQYDDLAIIPRKHSLSRGDDPSLHGPDHGLHPVRKESMPRSLSSSTNLFNLARIAEEANTAISGGADTPPSSATFATTSPEAPSSSSTTTTTTTPSPSSSSSAFTLPQMIWRTSATTSFGDFKPFLGFLSKEPFTQGELRACYLLWITQDQGIASGVRWVGQTEQPSPSKPRLFVAKKFLTLDGQDELSLLREDLFLQYKSKEIAAAYNQRNPPKPVEFVDCGIFLVRKSGVKKDELFLVEPYLEGDYVKYSNNSGWESGDRSTPLAFSHFSYEYTKGNLVVVDMQGVGDRYTDPGVHTKEEWWEQCELQSGRKVVKRIGPANFGEEGIRVFLNTHRCHQLCEELSLKTVNKLGRMYRTTTSYSLSAMTRLGQEAAKSRDVEEELENVLFGSKSLGTDHDDSDNTLAMW